MSVPLPLQRQPWLSSLWASSPPSATTGFSFYFLLQQHLPQLSSCFEILSCLGFQNMLFPDFPLTPLSIPFQFPLLILPPVSKLQLLECLGAELLSVPYLNMLLNHVSSSLMALNITRKLKALRFMAPHWSFPWVPDFYIKPLRLCLEA